MPSHLQCAGKANIFLHAVVCTADGNECMKNANDTQQQCVVVASHRPEALSLSAYCEGIDRAKFAVQLVQALTDYCYIQRNLTEASMCCFYTG